MTQITWYSRSREILISYMREIPDCTGEKLKRHTVGQYPYSTRMSFAYQQWLKARKDAVALLDAGMSVDRLAVEDWGKLRGRRVKAVEPSPEQMLLLGGE